jgi:hypothetical protein
VLRQAPLQHPFVIWDVIVGDVLKTAPTQTRKYRVGVGATDLVCGDGLAGFYELIAGGDDHAARLTAYRNARESGRGDHRELRCAQHDAGPQHRHARLAVLPASLHIAVGFARGGGFDTGVTVSELVFLLRDDAVCPSRQHCAGHHFDGAFRMGQLQRRCTSRLGGLDQEAPQTTRERGAADRDAIHTDAIKGWVVALGVDVLAQNLAGALPDWPQLSRHRSNSGKNCLESLSRGDGRKASLGFPWRCGFAAIMMRIIADGSCPADPLSTRRTRGQPHDPLHRARQLIPGRSYR